MNIFFTADEHYGHKKIIKYADRPWKDVNEMDRQLIFNHNQIVKKEEDIVWHIGDFAWGGNNNQYIESLLNKLNGVHRLILGNHDLLKPFSYVDCGFDSVHTSFAVVYNNIGLIMAHDPSISQVDINKMFLCGHIHRLFKTQGNCINVGVDVWNYSPVPLEVILPIAKEFYNEVKNETT